MSKNCLIEKFRHYAPLSNDDEKLLLWLQESEEHCEAGKTLLRQRDSAGDLFVVRSGWCHTHKLLSDGSRQILSIKIPGDIIGLREIAFSTALSGAATFTEATVCRFPKRRVHDVFRQSRQLTAIFFLIASREQAELVERITDIGRRNARQRLAHFILEMNNRLAIFQDDDFTIFWPLKQADIADTLGLTHVHVSRVLSRLKDEGLIATGRNEMKILDRDGLIEASGWDASWTEYDTQWFLPGVEDDQESQ